MSQPRWGDIRFWLLVVVLPITLVSVLFFAASGCPPLYVPTAHAQATTIHQPTFVGKWAVGEVPVKVDTTHYTVINLPIAETLAIYRNGLRQKWHTDFEVASRTITFYAASTPETGAIIQVDYIY